MKLFSSLNERVRNFHDLVFPYGGITRQLLTQNESTDGTEPKKILMQVAKIINALNNPNINASIRTSSIPELVVHINVRLYGLSNEEKAYYGEILADLVGHHEGQLNHLSYSIKGYSYTIGYIGIDNSESCTRCAKAIDT